MTAYSRAEKSLTTNPLKASTPLGAAMAFLGIDGAIPLFHGSQGCTSFALVLMVRHFKESIPLQTTAMSEVSTILGGADHLEEALVNLKNRVKPKLIGVCTTALVETRGEDFAGDLALIRMRRAKDLDGTAVVLASTPDFTGSLELGWSKAVTSVIEALVPVHPTHKPRRGLVAVLPGVHLTPADLDVVRDMVEAFGLQPIMLPDVSGSLDGTVPETWVPTSYGGTPVSDIPRLAEAEMTLAIGEHMRAPAEALTARAGVPARVFTRLNGLDAVDAFLVALSDLSGRPIPARYRRERSRLVDAMLDAHFHTGGLRVAIAAEPDLLVATGGLLHEMGADIVAAVTTVEGSPALAALPVPEVIVGDLGDLEHLAQRGEAEMLFTHAHGRQAAERLGVPLMRTGFPCFDRLGAAHLAHVGYEGTRDHLFRIANLVLEQLHQPTPETLAPRHLHGNSELAIA